MRNSVRGNFDFLSRYNYFSPGWADLVILVVFFLAGAVLGSAVSVAASKIFGPEQGMEYALLISYPIMFIPPMIYASVASARRALYKEPVPLDRNCFQPAGGAVLAIVASVGTIGGSFCSDYFTSFLPDMPEFLEEMLKTMTGGTLWIDILCVIIFAPIFEEWLCRGMVLRGLLSHKTKPVWAIVISAVFFALIHLNPWQAIPAFAMGLLMGYVYYKTGSLKLTMLMHCVNNSSALLLSRIPAFEEADTWADILHGGAFWTVFACCAIIVVLTVLAFRKTRSPYAEI